MVKGSALIDDVNSEEYQNKGSNHLCVSVNCFCNVAMHNEIFGDHTPEIGHEEKNNDHDSLILPIWCCKQWNIDANVVSAICNCDPGNGQEVISLFLKTWIGDLRIFIFCLQQKSFHSKINWKQTEQTDVFLFKNQSKQ